MTAMANIILPTIPKSESKTLEPSKNYSKEDNFESHLKKASKDKITTNSNDDASTESNETVANNSQIENQAEETSITNEAPVAQQVQATISTPNNESNIEKIIGELLNGKDKETKQPIIAALNDIKESKTNPGSTTKTPQSLLVQKIEDIIKGETTPQNISIKATSQPVSNTNTATTIDVANTTNQVTANKPISNQINLEESKIRLRVEEKAQGEASTSIFKNRHTESNPDKVTTTKSADNQPSIQLNMSQTAVVGSEVPSTPEASTIFGQVLTTAASTTSNQGILQGQTPNILPSGNIVYDDQVIEQIHSNFKINASQQQQKINIRLNPVELGELKINLTIKEGSVRVNVVAHSQQAQEILERNMPKLKAILEDQGLSVEDIMVSQETATLSDFQLANQDMGQGQSKQNNKENSSYAFAAQISTDNSQETSNAQEGLSVTI
ncbi:MAG: flagellar hook-length control protein FliK [Desulfotalea sp.]